jgi:transposase-like protein
MDGYVSLEDAHRLVRETGSRAAAARALGVPEQTFAYRISGQCKRIVPPWIAKGKQMIRDGKRVSDVAREFGLSYDYTVRVLKRYRDIDVPSWVPLGLHKEYIRLARDFDEFEAARWARSELPAKGTLKAVRIDRGRQVMSHIPAPPDGQMAIVNDVLDGAGVTFEEVAGRGRRQYVVSVRARVIHALSLNGFTASNIGRLLGRDHSTVLHLMRSYDVNGVPVR